MKGINIEDISITGQKNVKAFKPDQEHLIFSSFNSLMVFLSSMRFLGFSLGNKEFEVYYQQMMDYLISGK